MNRRHFLSTASAATLALALPISATAAIPRSVPTAAFGAIDFAWQFLDAIKIDDAAKIRLFGLSATVPWTLGDVREYAQSGDAAVLLARTVHINTIRSALAKVATDYSTQRYILWNMEMLPGFYALDYLETGDGKDLAAVANAIDRRYGQGGIVVTFMP